MYGGRDTPSVTPSPSPTPTPSSLASSNRTPPRADSESYNSPPPPYNDHDDHGGGEAGSSPAAYDGAPHPESAAPTELPSSLNASSLAATSLGGTTTNILAQDSSVDLGGGVGQFVGDRTAFEVSAVTPTGNMPAAVPSQQPLPSAMATPQPTVGAHTSSSSGGSRSQSQRGGSSNPFRSASREHAPSFDDCFSNYFSTQRLSSLGETAVNASPQPWQPSQRTSVSATGISGHQSTKVSQPNDTVLGISAVTVGSAGTTTPPRATSTSQQRGASALPVSFAPNPSEFSTKSLDLSGDDTDGSGPAGGPLTPPRQIERSPDTPAVFSSGGHTPMVTPRRGTPGATTYLPAALFNAQGSGGGSAQRPPLHPAVSPIMAADEPTPIRDDVGGNRAPIGSNDPTSTRLFDSLPNSPNRDHYGEQQGHGCSHPTGGGGIGPTASSSSAPLSSEEVLAERKLFPLFVEFLKTRAAADPEIVALLRGTRASADPAALGLGSTAVPSAAASTMGGPESVARSIVPSAAMDAPFGGWSNPDVPLPSLGGDSSTLSSIFAGDFGYYAPSLPSCPRSRVADLDRLIVSHRHRERSTGALYSSSLASTVNRANAGRSVSFAGVSPSPIRGLGGHYY